LGHSLQIDYHKDTTIDKQTLGAGLWMIWKEPANLLPEMNSIGVFFCTSPQKGSIQGLGNTENIY